MSQSSLSVQVVTAATTTVLSATETGKVSVDGFQALLDIGSDHCCDKDPTAAKRSLRSEDNSKDADFSLADADKKIVRDKPVKPTEKNELARDLSKTEESRKPGDNKQPVKSAVTPAQNDITANKEPVKNDTAIKAPAETADTSQVVAQDVEQVLPVEGVITSEDIAQLRAALFALLEQLSGQPVTDNDSAQQALDALAQAGKEGSKGQAPALPPGLLAQLKTLFNDLQVLTDLQASGDLPADDLSFDGILSRFNRLIDDGGKQGDILTDKQAVNQLASKIEALSKALADRTVTLQTSVAQNAQISGENTESDAAADLQSILSRISPLNAAQQDASSQQKSQQANANGVAASLQGQAKVEAALAKSGGFDTNTAPRDGAVPTTLARPSQVPTASEQTSPSFARILQQNSARPVIDQIVFQIRTVPLTGNSRIHIQLHPAELGKLDIKMDVDADGKTGITVTADNKQTLDLLQRDRSGLERALADAGLKTDDGELNFNLRGEQQNAQQQDQFTGPLPYIPIQQEEPPLLEELLTTTQAINMVEGLDIKI